VLAGDSQCIATKPSEWMLCEAIAFEHRLDRTARTCLSFIGAPESDRLPQGYRVPRAIELVYQARYIGEVRHRDARSPEAVPRSRSATRRPAPGRALV